MVDRRQRGIVKISHRRAFELFHQGLHTRLQFGAGELQADRLQVDALAGLDAEQRALLQTHLANCSVCRQDLVLSFRLRREALLRWPLTVTPKHSVSDVLQAVRERQHASSRFLVPLRLALLVALLLGGMLVLSWIINLTRPRPSGSNLPGSTPTLTWTIPPSPTPTAEPPAFTKTSVKPLILGDVFDLNNWSPDGRYLLIIKTEPSSDPDSDRIYSSLHFFDTQIGQVCQSGEALLGTQFERHTLGWLQDGKLLVASRNDISIYSPCSPQTEDISALFTDQIHAVSKPHQTRESLVLTGEAAFWIFEPESRNVRQVSGLVPSQSARDQIFSSPTGRSIAISQPAGSGSQISLVDLQDGQIKQQIMVPLGTEQSAAWIDWLLEDIILVYGGPYLSSVLVELQTDGSARMTPVLQDIFDLESLPPSEISGQGGFGDQQRGFYYLTLVTHSEEERALYIYYSAGDRVEKLPHDLDTFLFLPGSEVVNMSLLEETPSYTDIFELVWVDHPSRQNQQLTVQGHTPRQYPILVHAWEPVTQRMAFGSTQGVSLVSIPDGRLIEFWSLDGAQNSSYTNLSLSPDGKTLAVQALLDSTTQLGPPESAFYIITLPP